MLGGKYDRWTNCFNNLAVAVLLLVYWTFLVKLTQTVGVVTKDVDIIAARLMIY